MPAEIPGLPDPKHFDFDRILRVVNTPLSFLALVVLAGVTILTASTFAGRESAYLGYVIGAAMLTAVLIVGIAVLRTNGVDGLVTRVKSSRSDSTEESLSDSKLVQARVDAANGESVAFFKAHEREILDYWYRELRPVIHQAAMYSTPTYYLDTKLDVIDWNIAFALIFDSMTGKIRGKHVNWLIARLENHSEVFDHAKAFTENYHRTGVFPFVDLEPLEYDSQRYGMVRFTKVATQLHNADGQFKGWSIALMIDEMEDRGQFNEDFQERIGSEKTWSVYSASYDRVLNRFPPYAALIDEVISVLRPRKDLYVADLGAGTGNVTRALVNAGHRVLAVENNEGMLDRIADKQFPPSRVSVVKTSVEQMSCLKERLFDAAIMVNVLYAVDDPLECLRGVHRVLKPGGVLGMSTTHRETDLSRLLNEIEAEMRSQPDYDQLADDLTNVQKINRMLEKTIVRRHTREKYLDWIQSAGFEIVDSVPSTYCDAVMLVHARRPKEKQAVSVEKSRSNFGVLN
jgi:ubiquinone/menaquinone biosynthesis C-methylase UbiE